jgi:hypothetical protein
VHIIFNYNPYSIVNERSIAKIDAERNSSLLSPLMLAVFRFPARILDDPMPALLVELIGIEPTTPCLQSRCSPN